MNQKGFANTILVVVIVVLVGAVVYFAFVKKSEPATQQSNTSPSILQNETVNWKIYKNDSHGFELKYPTEMFYNDSQKKIIQFSYNKDLLGSYFYIETIFSNQAQENEILKIKNSLSKIDGIKNIVYKSSSEAEEEFKKNHLNNPAVIQSLKEVKESWSFPPSLTIYVAEPNLFETVSDFLSKEDKIDHTSKVDLTSKSMSASFFNFSNIIIYIDNNSKDFNELLGGLSVGLVKEFTIGKNKAYRVTDKYKTMRQDNSLSDLVFFEKDNNFYFISYLKTEEGKEDYSRIFDQMLFSLNF